jgi:hypothetical protein
MTAVLQVTLVIAVVVWGVWFFVQVTKDPLE